MKKQYKIILWQITLFFFSSAHAVCTVQDDAGNIIKLNQPAARIVSLAPDITEILFTIGAGAQVVGVMSGSDYPADAQNVPRIGSAAGIDVEKIISLKPDLIFTWDRMFVRDLLILQKMGVAVYVNKPVRVEDVMRSMRHFGCLTGKEKNADQVARRFATQLAALRHRYAGQQPVKVFYQVSPYSLMTVSKQSWINQAINLCGGKNIFAAAPAIAAEVSLEAVVTRRPQVIITASENDNWQRRWQSFSSINAVHDHLLFTITPDLIGRAGPRLIKGITAICSNIDLSRQKIGYITSSNR